MGNSMLDLTLPGFADELASKAPIPGGGGASALAGALGAALAGMVCALTAGKKKYAAFEPDIQRIAARAGELRKALLREIAGDAEAFEPLSRAYAIPKDDPDRERIMEAALKTACAAPMRVMELCGETLELLSELAQKGSALAISDVGVGAQLAKAALLSAMLNVVINVRTMKDRKHADALRTRMDALTQKYVPMADETFDKVMGRLT